MRASFVILAGLAGVSAASPALASACADQVAQLASRHRLAVAAESTGTRGGDASGSGSTVAPATQESRGVGASDTIQSAPTDGRPAGAGAAGPAASGAPPSAPTGDTTGQTAAATPSAPSSGAPEPSQAIRGQAEALLAAARAADAEQKEDLCFERLREVEALLSRGP